MTLRKCSFHLHETLHGGTLLLKMYFITWLPGLHEKVPFIHTLFSKKIPIQRDTQTG